MKRCDQKRVYTLCMNASPTRNTIQELRKLARACKVHPHPWRRQLLTSRRRYKHLLCVQLFSQLPDIVDYIPASQQIQQFISQIINTTTPTTAVDLGKFTGYPEAGIFGLLYLLERHKNVCVFLSDWQAFVDILKESYTTSLDELVLPWTLLGFVWDVKSKTLEHGNNLDVTTAAQVCTTRFWVTLLTIINTNGAHHANIVLYDTMTRTLERFDPYDDRRQLKTKALDRALVKLYKEADPLFHRLMDSTPFDFVDNKGIQRYQQGEPQSYAGLDPIGFCQPWVFLYADLRLRHPNQIPDTIPYLIRQISERKHEQLTTFIRQYSQELLNQTQTMFARILMTTDIARYEDPRVYVLYVTIKKIIEWQDSQPDQLLKIIQ